MKNSTPKSTFKAISFGEVLWDIFPNISRPGGAPMNAAYQLNKVGIPTAMISCVGNDELGDRLIHTLENLHFPIEFISRDSQFPTGTVNLVTDENNEAHYVIHQNVAWDHIKPNERISNLLKEAQLILFGSLAMRSEETFKTLMQLLPEIKTRVMDINIRMPFFDIEKVKKVLPHVDVLKLNKSELIQLTEILQKDLSTDEDSRVNYLRETYSIEEIILTKGSKGAYYYKGNEKYFHEAYPIKIQDTVGSGDAFLAGFISKRFFTQEQPEEILKFASALGAFITTKSGACPDYQPNELFEFIHQYETATQK